jgi:hypothetical protein
MEVQPSWGKKKKKGHEVEKKNWLCWEALKQHG